MLRTELLAGPAMRPYLADLARLRMAVFREWPYLYDGSQENEQRHLSSFAACPRAGLAVAFDGEAVVGCSSCIPLAEESEDVRTPFTERGLEVARFFYFGESVLLPAYRGQGVGVTFFALREAHARTISDCDFATFCAVRRPADHPWRPADAVPLDAFWRKRGFTPYPDLVCTMSWKRRDTPTAVENRLSFWIKSLRGLPLP